MGKFGAEFWDERYDSDECIYGREPNLFFKQKIDLLEPGKLLLVGEGEGRNAVYAASCSWLVTAVDFSSKAREKALNLAKKVKVKIQYDLADIISYVPQREYYHCAGIVFLHLKPEFRRKFHQKIINSLLKGGSVIMEVFDKEQLGKTSGGPQSEEMLYSLQEIEKDFARLKIHHLKKEIKCLDEGSKHKGEAHVIRFAGIKK